MEPLDDTESEMAEHNEDSSHRRRRDEKAEEKKKRYDAQFTKLQNSQFFSVEKVKGPTNRISIMFTCKVGNCRKVFNKLLNMQNHLRKHTGERPFKCFICHFSFTQSGNLNKHLLHVHKINPHQTNIPM